MELLLLPCRSILDVEAEAGALFVLSARGAATGAEGGAGVYVYEINHYDYNHIGTRLLRTEEQNSGQEYTRIDVLKRRFNEFT